MTPKRSRGIIAYLMVAILLIFLAAWMLPRLNQKEPEYTYSEIMQHFDDLEVKKYTLNDGGCACFEFIDPERDCCRPVCYHLKCEICGRLIHMECREITELEQHLLAHHGFRIDPTRTVFFGICEDCSRKEAVRI